MPETAIVYDDVEVLEVDGLGLTCRVGPQRVFIGKYVPVGGTTVHAKGDRGKLALPRWFVEQQGLPLLGRHLSDAELDAWLAQVRLRVATAQEYADAHPDEPGAQETLERATSAYASAMLLRARRQRGRY